MERSVEQKLSGWGRFRPEPCHVFRPERRSGAGEILRSGGHPHYIARGLGRSYGDPSVNRGGGVVSFVRLDRFVDFDEAAGVVTCEGGVALEAILSAFVPRGYFLPVTPGTKFVTLGGAIAADVHGKNHHRDGTFSQFVEGFDLLTPGGDVLACSRKKNKDLFWATVGGMGLTGMIVTARLRLLPIETACVKVDYLPAPNLDAALDAFEAGDADYQYSVAWIDCLARGDSLGRSVLMRANHAAVSDLPARRAASPLAIPRRRTFGLPFTLPSFALNRWSVRAFNEVFYRRHSPKEGCIEDFDSFFYPLDAIGDWNRMYGRRGFVQYQALLPSESSREGLRLLLERFSGASRASFLAVLKACGPPGDGMLSFPFAGYTLALDIKADRNLVPFLHELDALLLDRGGRLYLAKDSVMSADTFRAMYPRVDEFLAVKAAVDPGGLLGSTQSRRLGLTSG